MGLSNFFKRLSEKFAIDEWVQVGACWGEYDESKGCGPSVVISPAQNSAPPVLAQTQAPAISGGTTTPVPVAAVGVPLAGTAVAAVPETVGAAEGVLTEAAKWGRVSLPALGTAAAIAVGVLIPNSTADNNTIFDQNGVLIEGVEGAEGSHEAQSGGNKVAEGATTPATPPPDEDPRDGDSGTKKSQIDREAFRKVREAYWKEEAQRNPGKYSPEDLARMRKGRAPIGPDGKPIELHHRNGTQDGPLDEMSSTDHRGGANYKKNHPWVGK